MWTVSLSQGPVSSSDITTREKLTRPVVRMYHRHPGNELPEASELGKVWEQIKREFGWMNNHLMLFVK